MSKECVSHSASKSLDEWLFYLESIHNVEIDLGLTRIAQVANRLNIHFDFAKVITVAGTNGKGTTCAFLENALLAQQESVAVYSSPHIEKFNERLRINKVDIDDQSLIQAFEKIETARGEISLTYYEYTTLAAFLVLMFKKPKYIILEVGLGGRLDATNLIDADIAIITSVDLDHQAFLGDTREKIGAEKAGIMRANRPVIIGEQSPPVSVLDYADKIRAKKIQREKAFAVIQHSGGQWAWHSGTTTFEHLHVTHIPQDNVATALAALNELGITLTSDSVNALIEQTRVPGRTEIFDHFNHKACKIILDVGHNPHAARYLSNYLAGQKTNKILAVVGMLSDKDIVNTLQEISGVVDEWYFGSLNMARGASAQDLENALTVSTGNVNCFDNLTQAFKMATKNALENDIVLAFGSFFTVAEIRKLLVNNS